MSTENPNSYEALTISQIRMIRKSLTPLQASVLRVDEIDAARGAGIIAAKTKCVWTRDGHRITLSLLDGGGFAGSCSREIDPLADPLNR